MVVSNPQTSENNYFQFMIKCVIYKLFSVVQYKQETLVYTALITVAKPQE